MMVWTCSLAAAAGGAWYPLQVDIWEPAFNVERQRRSGTYEALARAAEPWRICVSIPHLKDAYWLAVNFAVVDEAKRLGVAARIFEAGGYDNLNIQREQIEECMESGADGLIVSAITLDGVNHLIERYTGKGKPVVDLINQVGSKAITARAAVDYWDNGYQAGLYLKPRQASLGRPLRVAWFPGPKGPGWSAAGDAGFRHAAADGTLEIVETRWGDTGRAVQTKLVEQVLDNNENLDIVVGTTVTAEAAVDVLRRRGLSGSVDVMAYYYGPGVHRGIRRGQILAAPTDKQATQARIAMDLVVRAIEERAFPRHVAPQVSVVDRKNIRDFDPKSSLPPRGFRPIFSAGEWK
jgi:protein TorT